ncbi:CLUMA_CG005107, isoform A [Clunio marinus]|uniref:CLUMA_CG005107, isoform A n=1 Tax=Clunio marinus TaxID=568069 RepID=A0A1J1HTW1_9DIPT|nr:CLUMA_CG005107, isoform A [Clunio marinus]
MTILLLCEYYRVDGASVIERELRIVGGQAAKIAQFPHAAALVLRLATPRNHAAHCLEDILNLDVLAGLIDITQNPQYRQRVELRDIRQHPEYDNDSLLNDIALIHLIRRIPFNRLMQKIALPSRSLINNRFTGSLGTIIGWGQTSNVPRQISETLRFVRLPVAPDQLCINIYNTGFRYFNPSNICISGARGSTCNGDSGSSMQQTINGEVTIIGIVSFGRTSCESGDPVAMTRVTSYLDWIAANSNVILT